MSALGGGGAYGGNGDKGLSIPLLETFRLAWADPDLRQRLLFMLFMFGVFALGTHIPVPIPGVSSEEVFAKLKSIPYLSLLDTFGGGALRRISILALGLNPYITASIIIQILTAANPKWKLELQEGGEYGRRQQSKRTRLLSLILCVAQGYGLVQIIKSGEGFSQILTWQIVSLILLFWTAGAMLTLWIGEQISEKGIGNGVSLMIFCGIVLSLPNQVGGLVNGVRDNVVQWWSVALVLALFLGCTWLIVYFTVAQRRIPIQHMRRQVGTKVSGGQSSYLPFSLNMVGVMPILFASSLIFLPSQFSSMFGPSSGAGGFLSEASKYVIPSLINGFPGIVACFVYVLMIFFFTYFWTAIQYNVEDIANNLKRHGSFVPGVRPGKQTKDFLDSVLTKISFIGAVFIAAVALVQFIGPQLAGIPEGASLSVIGGTSLLIMVSVALETMRQIEANLLMKRYGN